MYKSIKIEHNENVLNYSKSHWGYTILSCCLILWMATPYLYRNLPHIILLLITSLWVVFGLIEFNVDFRHIRIELVFPILWIAYILFYRLIGYSTVEMGNYYVQIYFWLCLFLGSNAVKDLRTKELKTILYVSWIIILINILDNIRLLIQFPKAASYIFQSYGELYLKMNIGAGQSYSFFALSFVFMSLLSWHYKLINKLFLVISIISSVVYIVLTLRTITILLGIIMVVLWYVSKSKYLKNIHIKVIAVIVIVSVLLFVVVPIILQETRSMNTNDFIKRIDEIYNFFSRHDDVTQSGSGATRLKATIASIDTWLQSLKSFLFGIGDLSRSGRNVLVVGIGQHSESIDVFARYGIIGAILYFLSLFSSCRMFTKNAIEPIMFRILYIIAIAYSFLNNFTNNSFLALPIFVLCPIINKIEASKYDK